MFKKNKAHMVSLKDTQQICKIANNISNKQPDTSLNIQLRVTASVQLRCSNTTASIAISLERVQKSEFFT